jgi:phage terminase small subunit
MARPRIPADQHELQGTFRADRHAGEPEYPKGAPPIPPDVAAMPAAVRAWTYYVERMLTAGTLTEADGAVLADLCVLTALREGLVEQLQAGGTYVVATELGADDQDDEEQRTAPRAARAVTLKAHPLIREIRALSVQIRGDASALGLTPTTRGRAGTTGKRTTGQDDHGQPTSRIAQLQAQGRQLRAV